MTLGLVFGTVRMADYDPEWKNFAAETIERLRPIFGANAVEFQHIGSTAIGGIKAKPVIDVAVGVHDFALTETLSIEMEKAGYYVKHFPKKADDADGFHWFIIYSDEFRTVMTHTVRVCQYLGRSWVNWIEFRDFLIANPAEAKLYEALKIESANKFSEDNPSYSKSKDSFVAQRLRPSNAEPNK